MKHTTHIKQGVRSYEEQAQTLALLKILALGNHEIEQGLYRTADEIFADLDKGPPSLQGQYVDTHL